MGERRDQYRRKDRRDIPRRRRCRCDWCLGPTLRKLMVADLETEEALALWHGGEPMPEHEWRLCRCGIAACRRLRWRITWRSAAAPRMPTRCARDKGPVVQRDDASLACWQCGFDSRRVHLMEGSRIRLAGPRC